MTPEEEQLFNAASRGDLDGMKQLCCVDVECRDVNGYTPLDLACENGHLAVVQYLVEEHGAQVNVCNKYEYTPLHFACSNGHLAVVRYLVEEHGAQVNVCDDMAIRLCTVHATMATLLWFDIW